MNIVKRSPAIKGENRGSQLKNYQLININGGVFNFIVKILGNT
jgi:hypothetical protein